MATLESLAGRDARERASIRAEAAAAAIAVGTYGVVGGISVEVVSSSLVQVGGVEVFARVYRDGRQLGFGVDGTVDVERFRVFNPPLLVEDQAGNIARDVAGVDGGTRQRKLREDPRAALLETIAHAAAVVGREGKNIIPGKVGNTVSTFYPDADVESTSVDGYVARMGVDQTFAAIIAGAGTNALDSDNDEGYAALVASTTSNQFSQNIRGIALFDTSAIPDGDTVSSAVISFYGNFKFNGLGSPVFHVVSSNPASSTSLAASDYGTFGSTSFGSVAYASYSTTGYNDITLNASGIAAVSKTGVSKFGTVTDWDLNASFTGVWASGAVSGFQWVPADAAGTSSDPKLVVTHSAPVDVPVNVSDTVSISESVSALLGRLVAVSDTVTLSESLSALRARTVGVSDTVTLSEQLLIPTAIGIIRGTAVGSGTVVGSILRPGGVATDGGTITGRMV